MFQNVRQIKIGFSESNGASKMPIISRFFLFLTLPILLLATPLQKNESVHYSLGPIPSWIKPCDFSLEPIPAKPSQVNWQCLLIDIQTNKEAHTSYVHRAVKVLSQLGVEQNGKLSFNFNPDYQKAVVHMIRVYRDGCWSDRLESAHPKLLQREERLDSNLYDGDLSLVYFLDDIRVGDIIEHSYSIEGENPFFSSHYCGLLPFQYMSSVEKISRRVLADPSQPFFFKPIQTSLEPQITDISPQLRAWIWEDQSTHPDTDDKNQPSWFDPRGRIQISQYKNWQEVAQKLLPLYTLPDDYQAGLSPEMINLVKKWKKSTRDSTQRASLAVRFVQDEVRYQGFEDGMGAFKPSNPKIVFERRFGDCKDKSFLLHTFLKLMDIPSELLLVNSTAGSRLSEVLPSPFAFNHVVLKISIEGSDYYVDPTITLQGGSLDDIHFPEFHWGLPLCNPAELIPLPKLIQKKPIEIKTTIVLTSPEIAEVKIHSVRYDLKADKMRRYIQSIGYKKLCEDSLKVLKHKYGNVTSISPVTISDDRLANILIIDESYFLPTRDRLGKQILKTHSFTIAEVLDKDVSLERNSPYTLQYPVWVKEHISIKNPFNNWKQEEEELCRDHESLHYRYVFQAEGENMNIHYELQHLKDHISVEGLYDYWDLIDEIDENNITSVNVTAAKKADVQ